MTMIYSNPAREQEAGSALDVEVFYVDEPTPSWRDCQHDGDWIERPSTGQWECGQCGLCPLYFPSHPSEVGWYWRVDEGEPVGPFDTQADAIACAQDGSHGSDDGALDCCPFHAVNPDSKLSCGGDGMPRCVLAMGCYCAGHARGNPASESCDTKEEA